MIHLAPSKRWYSNLLYLFLAAAFCIPFCAYMIYRIFKEYSSKPFRSW